MKAIAITKFGKPDVFEEITLPKPEVAPDQVLIKVIATSVNPLDYKIRRGEYPDFIQLPAILHGDVAGIIEEVGANVTAFSVGDEVYGCVGGMLHLAGALAEYVVTDTNLIAKKPSTLSFVEAAALPLVAETAWEGLITYAKLQPQQTILIYGGTGGVGHIAIQLAKWRGAKVFTTCSSEQKTEIAKQLGADVVINYKNAAIPDYMSLTNNQGFDVVFDTVGGEMLSSSIATTAPYGCVVSIRATGMHDLTPAFQKGLSIHTIFQPLPIISGIKRPHYQYILTQIAGLVDNGIVKPLIDKKIFKMSEVGSAHQYLEEGKAIGKVVVVP